MVISRLAGGIGNQMFQYAAARRISYRNNIPLKLDLSNYRRDHLRKFALSSFHIKAVIAEPEEVMYFSGWDKIRRIKYFIHKRLPVKGWEWVMQENLYFQPAILHLKGNVYLDGYWQSEKYFQDIASIIRQEFTLKDIPKGKNASIADQILSTNSVSIHVRRGDYVKNLITNQFHGTCSMQYYKTSIEIISADIIDPHFFIFSDDPEWVKEYFPLRQQVTFIDHNSPDKSYEDLRLLSLCRHHIIANSSFSWWGAWLCEHPGKKVIAPRRWFRNSQYDIRDFVPQDWILVDA